jgi:hypothetical protein
VAVQAAEHHLVIAIMEEVEVLGRVTLEEIVQEEVFLAVAAEEQGQSVRMVCQELALQQQVEMDYSLL